MHAIAYMDGLIKLSTRDTECCLGPAHWMSVNEVGAEGGFGEHEAGGNQASQARTKVKLEIRMYDSRDIDMKEGRLLLRGTGTVPRVEETSYSSARGGLNRSIASVELGGREPIHIRSFGAFPSSLSLSLIKVERREAVADVSRTSAISQSQSEKEGSGSVWTPSEFGCVSYQTPIRHPTHYRGERVKKLQVRGGLGTVKTPTLKVTRCRAEGSGLGAEAQ
ncbi:hypothetical protein R3P38DRAFT_2784579 [Favolaschia claudopus]|uniref:Uncharacterized protein n=1 Tax=Favolaschia claudopus TaxID=2862362 RepID=A0AAW0AZY5_9AGAR